MCAALVGKGVGHALRCCMCLWGVACQANRLNAQGERQAAAAAELLRGLPIERVASSQVGGGWAGM